MHSEYYEFIDLSNDESRKDACINALKHILSSEFVKVMHEAVRASHGNFNVTKESFWRDIFLPTNGGFIREAPRQGNPNRCPTDPYKKLDSQAWIKYLTFGNQRARNRINVTDSRTFFKYFDIDIKDDDQFSINGKFEIADSHYSKALHVVRGCRNTLFAHENPDAFAQTTFKDIFSCLENMCMLLRPLCKKEWAYQSESVRVYNKLISDFYTALGDTEYTVSKIMINAGIPSSETDAVKELLIETGLTISGDKVTLRGNITVIVDALSRIWLSTYSLEGKASLLRMYLPNFESDTVNALLSKTYAMEQLSESALNELADSGIAKAQHEKARRLLNLKDDNGQENRKEAYRLFNAAAEAGLPESQSQLAHYLLRENDPKGFDKARELLVSAIDRDDPHAYFVLGEAYLVGRGVEKDEKKAYEMFCRGAELGDGEAKSDKARCELYGIGTKKNELALSSLKMLSKTEPSACTYLGWYYYRLNEFDIAVDFARKAADKGNASAQYMLGQCYYYGEGVDEDDLKAVEWFEKASELGNSGAKVMLGQCYYNADGVDKDYDIAFRLFEEAANRGNDVAMYMLGECYYYGNGVDEDVSKAIECYKRSAEQGYPSAQYALGRAYYDGDGVEENDALAVEWFNKASEQGYARAHYMLGKCYYYGDGVERDYEKAAKLFAEGAESGNAPALFMLGNCYYNGEGVKKNYLKAFELFSESAEQEYDLSYYRLGQCCYFGRGTVQSYESAFDWFKKADEAGNSDGTVGVGLCYYDGRGVEKDDIKAFSCFKKASENDNTNALYMLGVCYYYGRGVITNYAVAAELFEKVADIDKKAARLLIDIYTDKTKLLNEKKAVSLSERTNEGSLKVGLMYASKLEGVFYYDKNLDYLNAVKWLEKARAQGEDKAQEHIDKLKRGAKSSPFGEDIAKMMMSMNSPLSSKIKVVFPDE